MKKFSFFISMLVVLFFSCKNEDKKNEKKYYSTEISIVVDSVKIYGTLQMPDTVGVYPIVMIIAGSGPTDRNGNNKLGVSAAPYRMLADSLASHNIATFRYDKRLIGKSRVNGFQEKDLRFDTYVVDAQRIIKELKADKRFSKVIVLGHSEGSLIGAIASLRENPSAFISLAGAGRPADSIIYEQLSHSNHDMKQIRKILDDLLDDRITIVPDDLQIIFRVTVQPYLSSWFKYNPKDVFSELKMPVLIINGTNDVQITLEDANGLKKVCKTAKLEIIDGMNHILKDAPADTIKNLETYSDPKLPLNQKLVLSIVDFVESL